MTSKQKFRLRYLDKYMEFLKLLLPAFTLYLSRSPKTQEAFDKAIVYLKRNEKHFTPYSTSGLPPRYCKDLPSKSNNSTKNN